MEDAPSNSPGWPVIAGNILRGVGPVLLGGAGLLAVLYPVNGVVTRYRLQYLPKGGEGTSQKRLGLVEIFKDVKRREGWKGLYKGVLLVGPEPMSGVLILFVANFLLIPTVSKALSLPSFVSEQTGNDIAGSILYTLLPIPFEMATMRMLASVRPFPAVTPLANFIKLFTLDERTSPLRNIFTLSRLAAAFFPMIASRLIETACTRVFSRLAYTPSEVTTICEVAQLVIGSALLLPFEIVAARLAVQSSSSSHDNCGVGKAAYTVGGEEGGAETSVVLRSSAYTGMIDCFRSIIREEGYSALWRAWPVNIFWFLGQRFIHTLGPQI